MEEGRIFFERCEGKAVSDEGHLRLPSQVAQLCDELGRGLVVVGVGAFRED
jgi:hypothetical protein